MIVLAILGLVSIGMGVAFFVAGTVGLLRFPDTLCRLHALTKADGLGLALVVLGAACLANDVGEVLRLGLVWALVLVSSATASHLVARHARAATQVEEVP